MMSSGFRQFSAPRLRAFGAICGIVPALLGAQTKRPMTADDLMRIRGVGGVAISPGGERVLYTISAWEHPNARGDTALGDTHDRRSHVWIVPFAGVGDDAPKAQIWLPHADGGEGWPLTSARDGVIAYAWSPDGKRVAYLTPDTLTREAEAKGYIDTFFNGMPQCDGTIINPSVRFYLERSAISYSDKITTPLLILHGSNDERVPIGQPMEFYRALKDRGKTTELVFYPREGHGFQEYYHQMDRMRREYEWIARYTLGIKTVQ